MKTYYSIYLGVPITILLFFIVIISAIFIVTTCSFYKSKKKIETELQQEREKSVYEEICLSDTNQENTVDKVTENIAYVHMQTSCN
jgi:uncharacterized protein YpmB